MQGALRFVRLRPRAILAGLSLLVLGAPAVPVQASTTGATETYIVLYRDGASSKNAASFVQGSGGQLVYNYQQIGVVIARSDRGDFASNMRSVAGVEGASATTRFATRLENDQLDGATAPTVTQDIPAGANSVNCVSGTPVPGKVAANDDHGHGTHTAGTMAAAANGIGIVGVAPNVRIAGIKAGNADGFFFPEAVVCAFVWVGTHGFNVTNNSYFADPWLFNCKNDPDQRAIWKAEQRAILYAQGKGVLVVAAEGNQADDLAHPTQDVTSPDDTTPVQRPVNNACVVIPVEIPVVVGVTADGNLQMKSFYSSYGIGAVQVVAPGGDSILQRTAAAPNGRVLSTWPAALAANCLRQVHEGGALYCYAQGTSMASPHAAGVAALIESLGMTHPGQTQARLNNTADPMPCPTAAELALYAPFPATDNGAPQTCSGGPSYNSWYGHGQVNALSAVS